MAFYDLTSPQYTGRNSATVFAAQDSDPRGFCMTADGTLLFMAGRATNRIYKYNLTVPFNPSSLVYASQSLDITTFVTAGNDMECIRCSATADFILFTTDINRIVTLQLSVAADLSTASEVNEEEFSNNLNVFFQSNTANGFDMQPNGNSIIAVAARDLVNNPYQYIRYDCTADPYKPPNNTEVYASISFGNPHAVYDASFSYSQNLRSMCFADSGNKIFLCGDNGVFRVDLLQAYTYTVPNDLIEIMSQKQMVADIAEMTSCYDVWVSSQGTTMWLLGQNGTIYEYNLTQAADQFDVSQITFLGANLQRQIETVWEANTASGRTFSSAGSYSLSNNGQYMICSIGASGPTGYTVSFELSVPGDVMSSDLTFIGERFDGAPGSNLRTSPLWKTDGLGYWSIGTSDIRDVVLSTAWDVSSESSITEIITGAGTVGLAFSDDGLNLYSVARNPFSDSVYRHALNVAFDPNSHTGNNLTSDFDATEENPYMFLEVQPGARALMMAADGIIHQVTYDSYWSNFYFEDSVDLSAISVGMTGSFVSARFNASKTRLYVLTSTGDLGVYSFPELNVPSADGVFVVSEDPHQAGYVLSDTQVQVTLFNDTTSSQTVQAISGPTAEVTFTNLAVATTTIAAGLEHIVTVTLPKDIPRGLDLTFTVSWDNTSNDTTFSVEYVRPLLWPFYPDWRDNVDQTIQWATSLTSSLGKTEHRRRLRTNPRSSTRLSHVVAKQVKETLVHSLSFGTSYDMLVPMWQYPHPLTAAASAAATRLFVDNSNSILSSATAIVLVVDSLAVEVHEVVGTSATYVDIGSGLVDSYSAGVEVLPAVVSKLSGNMTYEAITDKVGSLNVTFKDAESVWWYSEVNPLTTTYQPPSFTAAVPVLNLAVYRAQLESLAVDTPVHEFDTSTAFGALSEAIYPVANLVEQYSWRLKGRASIMEFMEFLSWAAGRYRSFWFVPDRKDMTATQDISAAATSNAVVIQDNGFSDLYKAANHGNLDIAIETYERDGLDKFYYRSVSSVLYNEPTDEAFITIDTQIHATQDLVLSNIKRITILRYVRLNSDNVSLKWRGPELLQIDLDLYYRTY